MAEPEVTTLSPYDLTAQRESIQDEISIITPIDAPFFHSIAEAGKPKNVKHQFAIQTLRAPAQNKHIFGSDPTITAFSQPSLIYNNVQLMDESVSVADTSEAVDTVGNSGTFENQRAIKMKELVGDCEWGFLREVRVDGTDSTAPAMRGLLNWQTTNISKATDATLNADGTVTGGTPREFTKDVLKTPMQNLYSAGGGGKNKMLTAYCGSILKDRFDQLINQGNANRRQQGDGNRANDVVDIYMTSWGDVKAEIHRTMPTDVFTIFDISFWKKATLIPFGGKDINPTSRNNRKYHMTVQHTLEARNEASSARITDLL